MVLTSHGVDFDSTVGSSKDALQQDANKSNIVINSGQSKVYCTSSNMTISGVKPVTTSQSGSITLVAGQSIQLLPGTKILAGGFMYASILSVEKHGKHSAKVTRLVTIEENEKIEEQLCYATSVSLINPFPVNRKGQLHAGEPADGSIVASNKSNVGLAQEQIRKLMATVFDRLPSFSQSSIQISGKSNNYSFPFIDYRYVLRL